MKVKFKQACEIEVTDHYDEEIDEPISHIETFDQGEEVEFDVVGEEENGKINIQFFDGSVAFGIEVDSYEITEADE